MIIHILENSKISAAFCRANSFVINKHKKLLLQEDNKECILKRLWKTEFDASLDIENKIIRFNSSKSKMIFDIKFGQ